MLKCNKENMSCGHEVMGVEDTAGKTEWGFFPEEGRQEMGK